MNERHWRSPCNFHTSFLPKSLVATILLLSSLQAQADFLQVSFTGTIIASSDFNGQFFPTDLSKPGSFYSAVNNTYFNTAVGDTITGNFYINLDILPPDEAPSSTQGVYIPDYAAFNNDPNVVVSSFTYNNVTVSTEQNLYQELSDNERIDVFDTTVTQINSFDQFSIFNAEKDGFVTNTNSLSEMEIFLIDGNRTMLSSDEILPFSWINDDGDDAAQGSLIMWNLVDDSFVYDYRATFSITEANAKVVPVPPALPLLGSALGMMGFVGWRRKAKAA